MVPDPKPRPEPYPDDMPDLWPASAPDLDPDDPGRLRPRFDWRLRSRTLPLGDRTLLMAILNLTPDSFSGDGLLQSSPHAAAPALTKLAVAAAIEALDAGADILDLGAESTRPNATPLTADEEQSRLLPVLEALLHQRPEAVVSVDTYHASTARAAAHLGAEIINDVSGLAWDQELAATVAASRCGLVLMHTRGRPTQWSQQPALPRDEVLSTVFSGLCEGLATAEAAGIATQRIVLDPGFGFGKQGAENIALLAGLGRLRELGRPLLIGLSRKRFLAQALQSAGLADDRRIATIAANTAAILAGAHILRVHDVPAAREAAVIADALLDAGVRTEE
jgi:dihydropteroate synthase